MKHLPLLILTIVVATSLTACHESLEDRAAREAREYTEKFCPTPPVNNTRTDSVTFDKPTKTYIYWCAFMNEFDDTLVMQNNLANLQAYLVKGIRENTSIRTLRDAGFHFKYVIHSTKEPLRVLYETTITEEDYR